MHNPPNPTAFILMGVSGCGKTAVGRGLATRLNWPFIDGDDHHPLENIAKMASGKPLEDSDRWPWLRALVAIIDENAQQGRRILIACSALKRSYRDVLRKADGQIIFVHLSGSFDVIQARLAQRAGHFMKPDMLQSQFAVLEPPREAWTVDIRPDLGSLVDQLAERLSE